MKLRFLLPSAIFLFCGLVSHAQVYEMFYQGFETGDLQNYTVTPAANGTLSTTLYVSGSQSLTLTQSNTEEVELVLDTLDFRSQTSLRYVSIEFEHIVDAIANSSTDHGMCKIWYKRANQADWTAFQSQNYDRTNGGTPDFGLIGAFNQGSYSDWDQTVSNNLWKRERFNLNNMLGSDVAANERLLLIKFVLRRHTSTTNPIGHWWIDNLLIRASSSLMVRPSINMVLYPDGIYHPSSRGARVELEATTTVGAGIDPDSVYLIYRVGSDPTEIRVPMSPVSGVTDHYSGIIPFYGYDTMMYFYCVARDATSNANKVTFPLAVNSWVEYKCVRGVEQPGIATPAFTGTSQSSDFPFPAYCNNRSQWIYDSALMASGGYGPGAITAMRFTTGAHTNATTRQRLQIRMSNLPTTFHPDTVISGQHLFERSYMRVVYDSAFSISEANAGVEQTINLQDTFYYAGKDLMVQIVYGGNDDNMTATSIRTIPVIPGKKTLWLNGYSYFMGSPFSASNSSYDNADWTSDKRPAMVITQHANLPLLYDMGFDTVYTSPTYGLISPTRDDPMTPSDHSVKVRLKNFGALSVNAIRISYTIDDTINNYYDWSGSLAGGAVQSVTLASSVPLGPGYHTLKVWVEDTLTASGQQYRDHEPYNDTLFSEFIVCDGAFSGVRNIGGPSPDYNTIEEFLFAVSRCGLGDSLIVRLAPGEYPPFTMPAINGLSENHYIVFEPQTDSVTFYSDTMSSTPSIVNLESVSNIRFRNIRFVRYSGALTDIVTLGMTSHNCHFENCQFIDSLSNPSAALRISDMINSGFANGLYVDSCLFRGGNIGVEVKGQASDILSSNGTVKHSLFYGQSENAIKVQNMNNAVIEGNEMYDVMSASSYVLYVNECHGTSRVMANKIYTSHGAGAVGLNNAIGTATNHFVIANNMVVCEDDGTATQLRSPFNIMQTTWADIVYNSVKLVAAENRNNVAAAIFGGSGTLMNSQFVNNIVVSLDNNSYAFSYSPGSETSNTVGHNVYYSNGTTLNRKSGASYNTLDAWQMAEPNDSLSVSVNPNFLNGSLVDLRTYNRLIKGIGIPIATVTTDIFDTLRSATTPCPGAFEFASLAYDFEPEALMSPEASVCYMPSLVELKVRIRNSGINGYGGSGLTLTYQVDNGPQNTVAITDSIPPEDTITISTGVMLALPANGTLDAVYQVMVKTTFAADPNQTNDQNTFMVTSKYHPATPTNILDSVDYARPATITPVAGIESWSVYDNTTAAQRKSSIYWYSDTNAAAPFFVGPTLVTDSLRSDTTIYFRQRRAQAIVRITQVEITKSNSTTGATPSMPYWMNNSRKLALQFTNVGDERAYLSGDSILTVETSSSSMNSHKFAFPDGTYIDPGQSLVVQYVAGNSANPAMTIHTGFSFNVSSTSKIGFLYKRAGVLEDAVALGTITSENAWTNLSIPGYLWTGSGVTITPNTAAGIIRTGFVGNNTDWTVATAGNPMFLNTIDPEWIRYSDNGCEGRFASATILLIAPPLADLNVGVPVLPEPACGMGMEDVTVTVHNYGIQSVDSIILNYTAGADTVTETVIGPLPANGAVTYTFNTQLNMDFGQDSLVAVKVWVDSVADDPMHANDTNIAYTTSYYTPTAPDAIPVRLVDYATRDTITVADSAGLVPVWYDYDMNPVDTGYTSVSDILYVGGMRGMSYLVANNYFGQVGSGTSTINKTAFPTPYQPNAKYAKQQYLYTAYDLRAAGLQEGYMNTIAFDLDSIYGTDTAVSFTDYYISLGQTSDTIFTGNSSWKPTQVVYHRSPMTITRSDCHNWMTHTLDVPFYWDGVSSLVVQLVHYKESPYTSGVQSRYTAKANTTIYKNNNTDLTPSTMEYVGAGTRSGNRPNTRFSNVVYGCTGPKTTYEIQMTNVPAVDMALLWPNEIDTLDLNSCGNTPLYVNVRNQGAATADSTVLYYYFDTLAVDSTVINNSIAPGVMQNVMFMNRHLTPGRHVVTVVVSAPGDNITSNDTVRWAFMVKFCGGTYTIAAADGDYHSFGEAIDTLNVAGIEGPVVFNVAADTYQEQVRMTSISGSSNINTISFVGTGDSVLLTAATSQNSNYVMLLDSVSNVHLSNFRIESRPTTNSVTYANALVMRKCDNITVDGCTIRVKGTINNNNASCVIIQDGISDLTFSSNVVDSGYYSIKTVGTEMAFNNIILNNNIIKNFYSQGINLRGVTDVDITSNQISAGVNIAGRGLRGIYLGQSVGNIAIKKNYINLIDDKTGGKMGIMLTGINCTASNPAFVVNNMISCSGTGVQGLSPQKPSGIWIDSLSSNISVLYNTVRVYCGPNATATYSDASYSFYAGASTSNIQVQNNIFSNYSKGYAYYVAGAGAVTLSNYNAYYTESVRPFAWGTATTLADLNALQTQNTYDANSLFEEPYFAADNDLHLVMTNFATKAQYIADVTEDIDGRVRYEIPAPTIGAHEMAVATHDMAVVRIIEPVLPASLNNPIHIESDSVRVIAQFYNNGLSVETNVQWYAYIEGHEDSARSDTINIGTFNPSQIKTDTAMLPTFLGMIDTAVVHVVVILSNDSSPVDNERTSPFYLAPAFNLAATRISTDRTGCDMQDVGISLTVRNDGYKDFPAGTRVKIGYRPTIQSPANVDISTMPGTVEDTVSLPSALLTGQSVTLPFPTSANLYPTDTAVNLKVRVRGWCKYQYDVSPGNDSTNASSSSASPIVDAFYTPDAPIGHDTTLDYGTWGAVTAEQVNQRPIRWYRDTAMAPFYSTGNNYANSCRWSNTPQYFHDSTYYLQCYSDKNCPSAFSEVHVHVAALKQNDMAIEAVLAPLGGRVYMENDTVRVRIANYGTQAQNNVPVTYQLMQANNILQTVTEICPVAIPAGNTYVYTFDSLLTIPYPTQSKNYVLTVWTDLPTDAARRNDTIRYNHTFRSLPESTYIRTGSSDPSFDVTRVSYNEIDLDMPPLGRGLSDLAMFNNPEYHVTHVTKGTTDSLIVEVSPLDATAQSSRCRIWVYIDFDRNGVFTDNEKLVAGESFYDNQPFATQLAIADTASYGYMRMRIAVGAQSSFPNESDNPNTGIPADKDGHTLDFLLFVDAQPLNTDIAVAQIVSPRSYLIRDNTPKVVSFRALNKGITSIDNPQFTYHFVGGDSTDAGTVSYTGTILPGQSAVVSLPQHSFPLGTTTLTIRSQLPGDENPENDILIHEYHRFHVVTLPISDDFEGENLWYAPQGKSDNEFSHNYWMRGTPNKAAITSAHSDSNAWVTDLTANIVTGKRGSVSYLYSPIFDISQIRADTISFYLRRNLTGNSNAYVEFFNYEGRWAKLDSDTNRLWYNNEDDHVFDKNTSGTGYDYYWLASKNVNSDFNELLQFRFVYSTPIGNSTSAAFGGGCAVDDFHIGRARRNIDAGVVEITYPISPSYGQTIYPEVVVKNYGLDTLRNITVGYTHYGTWLPKESTFTCSIAPDSTDTLHMTSPFVITSDFPEEFTITAFTHHPSDIYYDNDTVTQNFVLTPLDHDISARSFLYPLDHVIAGDTNVFVTMRIRNMGLSPIHTATATYIVNGTERVDEVIDFDQLDGPLESMEYYNYTFHHRIRANMGMMRLVGIIKSDMNDYIYNDTISKRIQGITSVTDVAAASIIVDTTSHNFVRIELVIENRGARGANNFEVGYFIDNDTLHSGRTEIYSRAQPIPALSTGYYTFSEPLPYRPGGYRNVTGFVHIANDNDPSNDTTNLIATQYFDIELVKVLVEENSSPDCRVIMQLRNVGNVSLMAGDLQLKANINGTSISTSSTRRIDPGETIHVIMDRRIPKSPTRDYTGTGRLVFDDANADNNQTSWVEVINYYNPNGVPTVEANELQLDQNYPNPFTGRTTVPFVLPIPGMVHFFVVDAMGHVVNSFERFFEEGSQSIEINMDGYPSGIYYYGIEVDGERRMKKMIMR